MADGTYRLEDFKALMDERDRLYTSELKALREEIAKGNATLTELRDKVDALSIQFSRSVGESDEGNRARASRIAVIALLVAAASMVLGALTIWLK